MATDVDIRFDNFRLSEYKILALRILIITLLRQVQVFGFNRA